MASCSTVQVPSGIKPRSLQFWQHHSTIPAPFFVQHQHNVKYIQLNPFRNIM